MIIHKENAIDSGIYRLRNFMNSGYFVCTSARLLKKTGMGRLRRGHSLEVIFEDETTEFRPSIDRLEEEELTDEWKNYRRLSRRQILIQQQEELHPSSVQVTLCSQCCQTSQMDNPCELETSSLPSAQNVAPRRRNSTYLALACANAVSRGAMTRNLRQMFETQPVRETQPLLSRAEIQQQIQAARLRRNSIAVLYPSHPQPDMVTAVPAVIIDTLPAIAKQLPSPPTAPPVAAKPLMNRVELAYPPAVSNESTDVTTSPICIRCDKCSSILTSSPVPLSLVINKRNNSASQLPVAEETREIKEEDIDGNAPTSKMIPTNREVVEEELPKPDTVKNARCLFESSFVMEANKNSNNFSTLQHVKSNPSSKILRSESSMTLDRTATRSSSVAGRPSFRWPSRQEHIGNRSPSPSPSPSPIPALLNLPATKSHKIASTLPSYYRSSPSLTQYRSSRHSLHSTDVESYMSEGGSDCWSSSDLESEASYSSSCGRDDLSDSLDGMRYISPDVMEKIRSYGMTLTFVNGKMVDEDDDQEPEAIAATQKVVQSIRSAGQSPSKTSLSPIVAPVAPVAPKNSKKSIQHRERRDAHPAVSSPPPRIVACLPKQEVENAKRNTNNNKSNDIKVRFDSKMRHNSGDSSASSGVSCGTNAGSDGSEHNSPFASLKRTKSANADHTVERSPSPGPRQSGTRKAIGSSPFGCYSVVYSFNASARSPMYV